MVTPSLRRHQSRRKVAPLFLLAFCLLWGCPQADSTPLAETTLADGGFLPTPQDMSNVSLPDLRSYPADQGLGLADATLIAPAPPTFTLVPLRWEGDEEGHLTAPVEVKLDEAGRAELQWPAGMWHVLVTLGNERLTLEGARLGGVGRTRDTLVPHDEARSQAAIFNPVGEPVVVELDRAQKALTLRRVHTWPTTPTPRLDAPPGPKAPQGIGDLFDQTLSALAAAPAGGEDAVVGRLLDTLRGHRGPVATGDGRLLWLAPGDSPSSPPQMRGSFSQWQPSPAHTLARLYGKLWGRFVPMPQGEHQYKLVYGDGTGASWFPDRANRHVRWDGIDTGGLGAFNSVLSPAPGASTLLWVRQFLGTYGGLPRDLYIYLPKDYSPLQAQGYPVVLIHDGNESITRGHFVQEADQWVSTRGKGVVLVFVTLPSQDVRVNEYTMGTADAQGERYAMFLTKDVLSWVEQQVHTSAVRSSRGVFGVSLGGLISFWTAMQWSETFGWAGGMSSSFFWADDLMIDLVRDQGCKGLRFYLDSGTPRDNMDVTRAMRDVLGQKGCDAVHREEAGGAHEWVFWQRRFAGALDAFLP